MNKQEFLRRLKEDLSSLTDEELQNALKYYDEYFADAHEEDVESEIEEYNIMADLAEENSACFLWCTNSSLRYGYEVLEAWGFTPKGIITWIKPRFTLGVYIRNASESMLLGVRGRNPVKFRSQPSWFFAPLTSKHSEKPLEQFPIIERLYPDGNRLELFARRKQHGWDVWGNDPSILSDVDIKGYPVPNLRHKK